MRPRLTAPLFALAFGVALGRPAPARADKPFELWPPSNGAKAAPFAKAAPSLPDQGQDWRFDGGTAVAVSVDAGRVLGSVTPWQFGCNTAWWDGKGWFNDPDRTEKAKQAGLRFWRWPGGSSSDNFIWDGDYSRHPKDKDGGDNANMNRDWAVSSQDFIAFCRRTGSEAVVTVNYAIARTAGVPYAADLAARWVRWFNVEQGFKVRYWEIGNEVYGPWEEGNKIDGQPQLTGDVYARDLRVIAAAMRKEDPDICIGAVGIDADDGQDWTGYHWWMRGLLGELKGRADFLILHQYFQWPFDSANNYTSPGDDALLGNLHKVADARRAVDAMAAKYAGDRPALPVALTEFNILNCSCNPSINLINGLYTCEVLGEALDAGYVASNFWDWKNGLDAKLKGDDALIADGDPAVPNGTPRPAYYAYVLYERAFGDHLLQASASDPAVKVYASRFSGGQLGLVVVNEDKSPRRLDFSLAGFRPSGRLAAWLLQGKGLELPQASFNGAPGPDGGGGPWPIAALAPYRVDFDPSRPLRLGLPPFAAAGLVLY